MHQEAVASDHYAGTCRLCHLMRPATATAATAVCGSAAAAARAAALHSAFMSIAVHKTGSVEWEALSPQRLASSGHRLQRRRAGTLRRLSCRSAAALPPLLQQLRHAAWQLVVPALQDGSNPNMAQVAGSALQHWLRPETSCLGLSCTNHSPSRSFPWPHQFLSSAALLRATRFWLPSFSQRYTPNCEGVGQGGRRE